jgi:hypothetical protein
MLMHYGRTHLAHGIGAVLDDASIDPLAARITSAGPLEAAPLICVPPKPRLWWLRRGATAVSNIALTAVIP